MATIAEMVVKIGANTAEFQRSLAKAQSTVQTFSRGVSRAGNIATLGLTAPLALVGKKALEMGMDAVESENLFTVAMGSMADSARAWSKELSAAVGVNEFELRKNIGTLNNMLKNMTGNEQAAYDMSKSLVELSHDMASFYNITQSDALAKLQSGITGEAEPLKRLGILLNESTIKQFAYNQGIAKQGDKLTETQKVMARYAAIVAQTTDAQGDMARTMDSPSNRLRVLKERFTQLQIEIGMKLIPVLINLLDTIDPVVNAITSMSDAQLQWTINISAFLFALGPALKLIGALGTVVSFLLTPVGLLLTAIGVAAALLIDWEQAWAFLLDAFEKGKAWIMSDGLSMFEQFKKTIIDVFNAFVNVATPIWESFVTFLVDFWNTHGATITSIIFTTFDTVYIIISAILNTIWTIITTTLNVIIDFWNANGKAILEVVGFVWNTIVAIIGPILTWLIDNTLVALELISSIFSNVLDVILNIVAVFVNLVTGNWGELWTNTENIVISLFNILKSLFTSGLNVVLSIFTAFGNILGGLVDTIFNGIATVIVNIVNFIIDSINVAIRAFNSFVSNLDLPEWLQDLVGDGFGGFSINEISRIEPARTQSTRSRSMQTPKIEVYLDGAAISEAVDRRLGAQVSLEAF